MIQWQGRRWKPELFWSTKRALILPDRARSSCPHGADHLALCTGTPAASADTLTAAATGAVQGEAAMTTTSRKDIDAELAAWLRTVRADQAGVVLDAYADLWLANDEAEAIVDKASPAAAQAHAKVNGILDRIVGA